MRKEPKPGPLVFAALAAALFLTACATVPRGATEADWREYLTVAETLRAAGAPLAKDSAEERRAVERFEDLLSDFKAPDFAAKIRQVYAEDAFFNDTLKTLRGVAAIETHLGKTGANLEAGTVDFVDLTSREGDYYFRWVMKVRAAGVAGGDEVLSVGMTHVRFDEEGKVALHQDFWDSTGGLFQHVKGLGWLLRRAKAGL